MTSNHIQNMEHFLIKTFSFTGVWIVLIDEIETFWHSLDAIVDLPKRDEGLGISGPTKSISSSNISLSTNKNLEMFMLLCSQEVNFKSFCFQQQSTSLCLSVNFPEKCPASFFFLHFSENVLWNAPFVMSQILYLNIRSCCFFLFFVHFPWQFIVSSQSRIKKIENSYSVQPTKVSYWIHHVSDCTVHNRRQQTQPPVTLTHNSLLLNKSWLSPCGWTTGANFLAAICGYWWLLIVLFNSAKWESICDTHPRARSCRTDRGAVLQVQKRLCDAFINPASLLQDTLLLLNYSH